MAFPIFRAWGLAAWLAGSIGWQAMADETCGGAETPCPVDGGKYYAALPAEPVGAPAVLWLHGYGSSGRSAVVNAKFAARYTDRGFALIAPDGQPFPGNETKRDWGVGDGYTWPRDDVAFLKAVLADATARHGLDKSRILVAGFSRGGSMAWDLACAAPESGAAFAAVAGAFWEPMVTTCKAPVHLHHTHGFKDRLVPLEGRKVTFQNFDFHQGNVMKGVEVWREMNGCMGSATTNDTTGPVWSKVWSDCEHGSLTFQLAPGGHGIPKGWTGQILDWFDAVTGKFD